MVGGNIAAAISAEDENYREDYQEEWWEVPQLFPRYARTRRRKFVMEVYRCLGHFYFKRSYHMTYESFCRLHHGKLSCGIQAAVRVMRKYKLRGLKSLISTTPPVPNGPVTTSIPWACTLQYFAGGSPYDLGSGGGRNNHVNLGSARTEGGSNLKPVFFFKTTAPRLEGRDKTVFF